MSAPARSSARQSAARAGVHAPARGVPSRRPPLRLVPPPAVGAPRTPFVLLVLMLLGGGLVALLLLNAAAVANSNRQQSLRDDTNALRIREQQLIREVSALDAPGALAAAAAKLGMEPGGAPAFLIIGPDGTARVAGKPTPAPEPTADDDAGGGR